MVNPDNFVFIHDIIKACDNIFEFVNGYDYGKFIEDKKTVSAVLRELIVVGEAAKNTSEDFRHKYKQIPWEEIFGMRNKLVHDYMGIQYPVVWQTAQEDVPSLKKTLTEIVELDDTAEFKTV